MTKLRINKLVRTMFILSNVHIQTLVPLSISDFLPPAFFDVLWMRQGLRQKEKPHTLGQLSWLHAFTGKAHLLSGQVSCSQRDRGNI